MIPIDKDKYDCSTRVSPDSCLLCVFLVSKVPDNPFLNAKVCIKYIYV